MLINWNIKWLQRAVRYDLKLWFRAQRKNVMRSQWENSLLPPREPTYFAASFIWVSFSLSLLILLLHLHVIVHPLQISIIIRYYYLVCGAQYFPLLYFPVLASVFTVLLFTLFTWTCERVSMQASWIYQVCSKFWLSRTLAHQHSSRFVHSCLSR